MTRRTALGLVAAALSRAAGKLPANKNVRWALGANLWNSFPRVPFTDILDVMKDTGFIGLRLTQFNASISENATDPRVGGAVKIPRLNWIFSGFYGYYYQAPPRTHGRFSSFP